MAMARPLPLFHRNKYVVPGAQELISGNVNRIHFLKIHKFWILLFLFLKCEYKKLVYL